MDDDILLCFGGEVKSLAEDRIGGYLIRFSSAADPDLDGDYFTPATDFDLSRSTKATVYYSHGLDETLKRRVLGVGEMKQDEVGIWLEAQLKKSDAYAEAVMALVKKGKLGWSSGTAAHLVERKAVARGVNEILRWPLGIDASITPTPAEPRTLAMSLKSYADELKSANFDFQNAAIKGESRMLSEPEQVEEPVRRPQFEGKGGLSHSNIFSLAPIAEEKSYGERFIESREFKDFLTSHSLGSESRSVTFNDVSLKTVMTTTTSWAPENRRSDLVVPYATRPIQVTDVIPTISTTQNAYVYMEHTTFTNTAAETAEGAAKPEATLVTTQRSSPVRKIPVYVPVTDEQIEDVPGLLEWVESQLGFMVRQRLDSQIINGDGIAPNLGGILANGSIQTQAKGADPTPDAIKKAMNKIRVTGRAVPSAVLIHPNDWQDVQLLRTVDGIYIAGSPWDSGPERIWGIPVVQTDACPEGTAIVGDFANFTRLVERKSLTLKVGYNADDFVRNQRTIIAEMRVAFVILRPTAICTVTGV